MLFSQYFSICESRKTTDLDCQVGLAVVSLKVFLRLQKGVGKASRVKLRKFNTCDLASWHQLRFYTPLQKPHPNRHQVKDIAKIELLGSLLWQATTVPQRTWQQETACRHPSANNY